jgi:hypothetical protein
MNKAHQILNFHVYIACFGITNRHGKTSIMGHEIRIQEFIARRSRKALFREGGRPPKGVEGRNPVVEV